MLILMNFSGIIVFAALCFLFINFYNQDYTKNNHNGILLLLGAGFLFRILISPFIAGYNVDIGCFSGWSEAVFQNGFSNFYSSVSFADYPPGYIYILYLIGAIKRLFSIELKTFEYITLLKLPAMLADLLCGLIIYKLAIRKISKGAGLISAALFIFNPMVYLNSSWWGQVDSVFTLIIILSLIGLYDKKHIYSALMFSLALLVKPQAVIVFPVFVYYIINLIREEKLKGVKSALYSALAGAVLFFVLVLPFSPKNPFWIFSLYMKTLSSYPYASLNTPNFFGMSGGNGINIYNKFLFFDYNIWSNIFIACICAVSAVIYFRNKNNDGIFSASAFLITGMYMFAAKMHERYIFPAIAFFILYYIVSQKRLSLLFGMLLSLFAYLATAWVLYLDVSGKYPWISAKSPVFIILSFFGVVTFICMTVWMIRNKEKKEIKSVQENKKIIQAENKAAIVENQYPEYTKKEIYLLLGLTLIYTIIAFFNLGDMKAPETTWENKINDVAIIDTGKVQEIAVFNVFNGRKNTSTGVGDKKVTSQYRLEVSNDGENFELAADFGTPDVFRWAPQEINKTARFLRLRSISDKDTGYLNEIALYDNNKQQIKIESVTDYSGNTINALFDEQDTAVYRYSFKNGTYFDEIYHARTAYEYIHGIEAYEWTHPPLGKLFIALGIKIFGMNPFGWRFMGTLFGVLMLPIMYALSRRIFKNGRFAFLATFLLCFDFMHFTQTRIATIDTYATFFVIIMFYFMYRFFETNYNKENVKISLKYLLYAGLFFGIGAASKWTCIYSGGGLAVIFVIYMYRRYREYKNALKNKDDALSQEIAENYIKKTLIIISWCAVYFLIIPVCIYCLSYLPYAFIKGNSYALKDIWKIQENMYNYHSKLVATHSYSSPWYSWPLLVRPMWYYTHYIAETNKTSCISAFGNPAVWWTSIIASIVMVYIVCKRFLDKKNLTSNTNNKASITAAMFILIGYLAEYLPFVGVKRIMFIYHYFTSVPFIILIITFVIWQIFSELNTEQERKIFIKFIYGYMGVVLLFFIMFYPVISGFEVPKWYITNLTWFKTWVFGG